MIDKEKIGYHRIFDTLNSLELVRERVDWTISEFLGPHKIQPTNPY